MAFPTTSVPDWPSLVCVKLPTVVVTGKVENKEPMPIPIGTTASAPPAVAAFLIISGLINYLLLGKSGKLG